MIGSQADIGEGGPQLDRRLDAPLSWWCVGIGPAFGEVGRGGPVGFAETVGGSDVVFMSSATVLASGSGPSRSAPISGWRCIGVIGLGCTKSLSKSCCCAGMPKGALLVWEGEPTVWDRSECARGKASSLCAH